MARNKTLLIIIAALLISNLVMLYFITRPEPKATQAPELSRTEKMVKMLQEELSLDSVQTRQYLELRARRDSLLKPYQAELRTAKLNLLGMLSQDSLSQASIDSAAAVVGARQSEVEGVYFRHFRRMQQMLRSEQKPLLDTLLIRMVLRGPGGGQDTGRQTPSGTGN